MTLLIGVVLPVAVGLVTTKVTSARVKAILLAALSAVTGVATEMLASPDGFDIQASAINAATAFVLAVATHFGLLKPTGISGFVQERIGRTAS